MVGFLQSESLDHGIIESLNQCISDCWTVGFLNLESLEHWISELWCVRVQGVAIFTDLAITSYATNVQCQLSFSTTQPALSETSQIFYITYGPGVFQVTTQPAGAFGGSVLQQQPVLSFKDLGGQLMLTENGVPVTAELVGPGASLSGDSEVCSLDRVKKLNLTVFRSFEVRGIRSVLHSFACLCDLR